MQVEVSILKLVVIHMVRRQWVKEEDLAKVLRLHPKQLRRTLRVLEEEMLVIREHRKEVSVLYCMNFVNTLEFS